MPPTNNHAERALLGTARRQSQPIIPFLFALFTADIATAQAALYADSS